MTMPDAKTPPRFGEFVVLMAVIISLVAFCIDAMLPALSIIAAELGVHRANNSQLIISLFILGLAVGQVVYGPLSDSTGRKPALYAGLGLFIIGSLVSMLSEGFAMMLAGRIIQGLGLAGPRSVTVAIIRDRFEGRAMARVMSIVMAVFIIVPAIAPALGQGILILSGWRAIFAGFTILGLVVFIWFGLRQPETLAPARRARFSAARIAGTIREICAIRETVQYTLAAGLVFGSFQGYLNSAQQIIQIQYARGDWSPLYYAALALSVGAALLLNAALVVRFGMRRLIRASSRLFGALSVLFFAVTLAQSGHPPLWELMLYLSSAFFCLGLMFGNLNALAMQPLGHFAGAGAAVVGSLSILLAVPIGIVIGQTYNGTVVPLVAGFTLLGAAACVILRKIGHP